MRRLAVVLALTLAACGRNPVAPEPCTVTNAARVDTVRTLDGAIWAIVATCR